jgi:hypothetical protein
VGLATYGVTLAGLVAWEQAAAPRLKRRGILPDVPTVPGLLTEEERAAPFLTPLTCDRHVPPPTVEELRERGRHPIGTQGRVTQYIAVDDDAAHRPGVGTCEISHEWTTYYAGTSVRVEKVPELRS